MREHTPEFIELEKQIRAAMDEFVSDIRHIRFVESSDYNWVSMHDYLDRNDLDAANPEHLHLAYEALTSDHLLELLPLGHAQEIPPQPPAPAPATIPQPVVAPARTRTFAYRNGAAISLDGAKRL